jgi:hypothetical protein
VHKPRAKFVAMAIPLCTEIGTENLEERKPLHGTCDECTPLWKMTLVMGVLTGENLSQLPLETLSLIRCGCVEF